MMRFFLQAGTQKIGGLMNAFFWRPEFLGCVASFLVMVNLEAAST